MNIRHTFLLLVILLLAAGCGSEESEISKENLSKQMESVRVQKEDTITWTADVTHDGTDDSIIIDLTYIKNYPENEEPNIKVYSGSTGDVIWEEFVSTVNTNTDGIYLYNDGEKDYLMTWKPYSSTGNFDYKYKIMNLKDSGEPEIVQEGEIDFSLGSNNSVSEDDYLWLQEFSEEVNKYLKKSILLVDTNSGEGVYSTPENKITGDYEPEDDLSAIKSQLEK